ncbi:MAG: hypothetical protein N2B00_05210, partial [Vibrio fluvialis]
MNKDFTLAVRSRNKSIPLVIMPTCYFAFHLLLYLSQCLFLVSLNHFSLNASNGIAATIAACDECSTRMT